MRLLNTRSLEFSEFFDENTPSYAILSHRWQLQEVSYKQFLSGSNVDGPGYTKILAACQLAESRNHEWIWIDTCCIDKTSSAELSEAINSMFEWYQRAAECFAYLADVQLSEDPKKTEHSLYNSAWFTRGWTLQELLAPSIVIFFDSSWSIIGSKSKLVALLSRITIIPARFLLYPATIHSASVAMRMSWAARRTTTRVEDNAYSLLGIFNVNMPLLYGERQKAFFRLQLEIIKSTDDESVFAWTSSSTSPCGMIAPSPSCFAGFGNVRALPLNPEDRLAWQYTNKGLELRLADREDLTMGGWKMFQSVKFGLDTKVMTLASWVCEHDGFENADPSALKKATKGKIVSIELRRFGNSWKRVNAQQVLLAKEFERYETGYMKHPVQHRFYYVSQ